MPWLSELVTEGSFEILPVRSLCEFMLGQTDRLVKIHNSEADGTETIGGGDKSPKKGHKSQTTEVFKEDAKSLQLLHYLQVNSDFFIFNLRPIYSLFILKFQNAVQRTSEDAATEILEFFFRRLSFPKAHNRIQGIQVGQTFCISSIHL